MNRNSVEKEIKGLRMECEVVSMKINDYRTVHFPLLTVLPLLRLVVVIVKGGRQQLNTKQQTNNKVNHMANLIVSRTQRRNRACRSTGTDTFIGVKKLFETL